MPTITNLYDTQFPGSHDRVTIGAGVTARVENRFYNSTTRRLERIELPIAPQQVTIDEYDAAGRIEQITLPGNRIVHYSYDAESNVTGITDPRGNGHQFRYNPFGQIEEYIPPTVSGSGATTTEYAYNEDRQLDEITKPDLTGIDYQYGAAGRLLAVTAGDIIYKFSYYPAPIPTPAVGAPGKIQTIDVRDTATGLAAVPDYADLAFEHDGELLKKTTWHWTPALAAVPSLLRSYNDNFQVVQTTVNDSSVIAHTYDDDGLLVTAGDIALDRDGPEGRITEVAMGGSPIVESRTYNGFGELESIVVNAGSNPIVSLSYPAGDVDAMGRIGRQEESFQGGSPTIITYAYHPAGELSGVSRTGYAATAYEYDANGNREMAPGLSIAPIHDDQDRLLEYGGTSYEYSEDGERTAKIELSGTTLYAYNALGALRSVDRDGEPLVEYVLDATNRRVGKKVGGILVQAFVYDGLERIVAELDGTGAVVSRFVYASRRNVPDYMIKSGTKYRILGDHLGSVRLVVDAATGLNVMQRLEYDEFGRVLSETGTAGFQPFGFAGGLYDRDTGLVRLGVRDYDPEIGRWTTKDGLVFRRGELNRYAYSGSDPVNFIDLGGDARICRRLLDSPVRLTNPRTNHENILYDDGTDSGFFTDGVRPDRGHTREEYDCSADKTHYDDERMRQAEKNLRKRYPAAGSGEPSPYKLLRNNCQHYMDAVRDEYRRISPIK